MELVGLGAEPRVRGVGEDRVEHHKAFDESSEGGQLAVPVVGVINCLVERLGLNRSAVVVAAPSI